MTDDQPEERAEAAPAPPPDPPARAISLRSLLAGLVLLALVAAVAVAIAQQGRVGDLEDDLDARTEVATAASRFGEVYLTYDAADIGESGDRVLELVSPEFAEDFTENRAPGIEELLANLGTSTTATVSEVYVGDLTADAARVLVVVDVEAQSEASGTQVLSDLSFVLELVNVDGEWLVDEVLPAPQPDISGDGLDPSTTTTAAPGGTTSTTAAG